MSPEPPFPFLRREFSRPLRIVLVQPSSEGGVDMFLAHADEDSEGIGFKPPIGLLYLATTLKVFSNHHVTVLDAVAERLRPEATLQRILAEKPDLVGISAWTNSWFSAHELGCRLKEAAPQTFLVYGGPHVGIYPKETLAKPFVDAVIVGDGEYPLLQLAALLADNNLDLSTIAPEKLPPGLHLKKLGVQEGEQLAFIQKELDALPIPDRRFLPLENYSSILSRGTGLVSTMITSRGCPFRCVFCKLHFQKTLCRSAESILEEFTALEALGIKEVEIYDDTFTWSKERVQAICEGLIQRKSRIEWAIRDRVTNADPELLQLLYKAGCRRVHYGVESGVESVLKRMKKNILPDQARTAVREARKAGMIVLTYFMFGNLDESKEEMRRTLAFALELDAHYAEFSVTVPYPGTEMYTEALEKGWIPKDFWKAFAENPTPGFTPTHLIEQHASKTDLIALRDEATHRFYFRPSYLLKQTCRVRSLTELFRKAKMAWKLFSSRRQSS